MTHTSNSQLQRYSWIDLTRTIGAFFIILIHVSDTYTNSFKSLDLLNWIAVVAWNVIPRAGVPLFIAISGYVVLEKQDAIGKRIYRLIKPLVFWSIFYFLLAIALQGGSNPDFVRQLFVKGFLGIWAFAPHLWFLYMLMGLYVSLPISRILFKHLDFNGSMFLGCACLANALIFNITSAWALFTGETVSSFYSWGLGWANIYFGYFVLPKLLIDRQYLKLRNIYLSLSIVISTLVIFSLTLFTSLNRGYFSKIWEEPQSIFIFIQAIAIILLIQSNEHNIQAIFSRSAPLQQIVKISSKHALGIYAIHYFFVRAIFYVLDRTSWQSSLNHYLWLVIIAISILVWILSLLTAIVAAKNNLLKQVV